MTEPPQTDLDRPQWIDAFVMRLNQRGCACEPHVLVELAEDHFLANALEDPHRLVDRLVEDWGGVPQHD